MLPKALLSILRFKLRSPDKGLLNHSQRLHRFRYLAIAFLVFLLVPLGAILYFGFQQLENNLLDEYQRDARKLEQTINENLTKRRMITNTIPIDAFDYYRQVYNPYSERLQQTLSPLSQFEYEAPKNEWLVGYFQFCNNGHFNSPIWPDSSHDNNQYKKKLNSSVRQASNKNIPPELTKRKNIAIDIYQLLLQSESVQSMWPKMTQQVFSAKDELFSVFFDLPEHFIFYRIVTVGNQYWLQGYIVKRKAYLTQLVKGLLEQLHFDSPVLIELRDESNHELSNYFLYQDMSDKQAKVSLQPKMDEKYKQQTIHHHRLMPPFDGYSLTLSTNSLPMTPAMTYSSVFIIVLIAVILSACYGFYRLGIKQLVLSEQRLNFVSSVSHELKTPLTSIRMYSQMLNEETVISEIHKRKYSEFIYGESERLTRLIDNILQLSSLNQQQQNVQPEYIPITLLVDLIRSKTSSIIDKYNFQQSITLDVANPESMLVLVEQDAFSQVIINITDNAIKFFDQEQINDSDRHKIDFILSEHPKTKHLIQLEIRDYGEGITPEQESKIFELFYRGGNELTRNTRGTGIGLALVNELVSAQQGEIRVERKTPGLSMLLSFQCKLMNLENKM